MVLFSRNKNDIWNKWFISAQMSKASDVENVPLCVSVLIRGETFLVTWSSDIVVVEWNELKSAIRAISIAILTWIIFMRHITQEKTVMEPMHLISIYPPMVLGFL